MSLKAFHIVFIAVSILLSLSLAGFALNNYLGPTGTRMDLTWAGLSLAGGGALLWYGKYFLKKLRNISYL